jgi:hypothetical protein
MAVFFPIAIDAGRCPTVYTSILNTRSVNLENIKSGGKRQENAAIAVKPAVNRLRMGKLRRIL